VSAYTLIWLSDAFDTLGEIWLANAEHRRAITAACDTVEQRLAKAPTKFASPLSEGLWVIEIRPLRVMFQISEADRRVEIVAVRLLDS
jgi:hypothetical protein